MSLKKILKRKPAGKYQTAVLFGLISLLLGAALIWQISSLTPDQVLATTADNSPTSQALRSEFKVLLGNIRQFEDQQNSKHTQVVDQATIQNEISAFTIDFAEEDWADAQADIANLRQDLARWKARLDQSSKSISPQPQDSADNLGPGDLFVPILLYHNTPPDFENQLKYLQDHGYKTVTLDQVAGALLGKSKLPAKPVVITFDDGYENQTLAFKLLEKYKMKATFFIIINRADSGCDTLNANCDPEYLSWSQIEQFDNSGLITIGDHTVSHPKLTSLSLALQQSEILGAKHQLEQRLNHKVTDFAYPYGNFDEISVDLVRADGFTAAVSTIPGMIQSKSYIYSLHRIRSVYGLP